MKKHHGHKMKIVYHRENSTIPCLHCSCGSTWSAPNRALHWLVDYFNQNESPPKEEKCQNCGANVLGKCWKCGDSVWFMPEASKELKAKTKEVIGE